MRKMIGRIRLGGSILGTPARYIGFLILCGGVCSLLLALMFGRIITDITGQRAYFDVRIRILHDISAFEFVSDYRCDIVDPSTGEVLRKDMGFGAGLRVASYASGIRVGEESFPVEALKIEVPVGGDFSADKVRYRGSLDIIRIGNRLDAVNVLDVEDYLKGVVPREMSSLWPSAALKAQAIASRSFAVYRALKRRGRDYELTSDTFSQVYGGLSAERWRTNRAIEETRGKVLEYDGTIFPAYFHSCCGGHTEDMGKVWGEEMEPLKGVKCLWCRWSPYFRWRSKISTADILKALNARGYAFRNISDIREGPRDISGRIEYVRVRFGNKWFEINAEDFLSAIGRKMIKSTNFRIRKYPTFYIFSGYGWGHGVGMCQWGAFGLALRWWSTEKILQRYYPGTTIVDMKEVVDQ